MRARRWWLSAVPHADAELKEYLQQLGEHQTTSIGSSLKFCLVAEGQAQLYPRFGPTNIGIPPLVMLWLQLPERTFLTGRVNAGLHSARVVPESGIQSVYLLINLCSRSITCCTSSCVSAPSLAHCTRPSLSSTTTAELLHPAARHRARRHCYRQ